MSSSGLKKIQTFNQCLATHNLADPLEMKLVRSEMTDEDWNEIFGFTDHLNRKIAKGATIAPQEAREGLLLFGFLRRTPAHIKTKTHKEEILFDLGPFISHLPLAEEDIAWVIRNPDLWFRKNLVRNPFLSESTLGLLSKDPSIEVRCSLAKRDSLPSQCFFVLAQDKSKKVRNCVAENRDCPAPILETLSREPYEVVRCSVAANPTTPTPTLKRLLEDPNRWVRINLTKNPSLDAELLNLCLDSKIRRIVLKTINHPNMTKKILRSRLADGCLAPATEDTLRKYLGSDLSL